jgi:non-ribosomal peptide synthetase component F
MTARIADIHPLTSAQAGLLVSSLTEREPGLYVVQMRFALSGQLDRRRLEFAWEALTARHEVLRTAIMWEKTSKPVNVVMTDAATPVTWIDLSGLDDGARPEAVDGFLTDDRRRGFDLQHAPLSRVTILTFGEDQWEMVWTHHHVILDGWSTARLVDELWHVYTGRTLPGPPPPFKDFATALAADAEQNRTQDQTYWRERVAGEAALVTVDRPRDASAASTWMDDELHIPRDRLDRWRGAARRHGTTLSTLYHATWALTLRASGLGPDELVLGTVVDTRGTDSDDVIGLCVASVPLRIAFDDRPVGDWLRGIAVERATSQAHAGVNLAEHRTWSEDRAEVPFRYLLAVEGYPHKALIDPDTGDQLKTRYLGVHESTEYALTAGVPAGPSCLKLTFDTRRITAADAAALLDQWTAALDALAASPLDGPLTDLLATIPPPASTGRTLPERICELAREHPDRPAFRDASSCLGLEELDRASKRVAGRLRAAGLHAGDRVGVLVDDSVAAAVAILATLTAGGVVVSLDPRHPAPYRAAVISSAGVRQVLTSRPDTRPEWNGVRVLAVSEVLADDQSGEEHPSHPGRAGLAFLIHNAGSALHPMATAHDHDSIMRTATVAAALLGLTAGDDWLVTRPATGAAAPWEMWVAPLNGGCTVIAPGIQHQPDELARLATRETVAVISVTRSEAQDLAEAVDGDRGQLVSATRTGTEITLLSARGEHLGRLGDTSSRPAWTWAMAVDGVPVDPAHIEGLLLGKPGITSCVVRQEPDARLEAVVGMTAQQTSVRDLSRHLRSSLPEALVPCLTLAQTIESDATAKPPQPQVEQKVRRLWSEVLGLHDVPLDTPFFDLGGHSLLLFTVLRGLKNEGWTTVDMTDLLTHPTVRSLSRRLCQPDPRQAAGPPEGTKRRRSTLAGRRERGRT